MSCKVIFARHKSFSFTDEEKIALRNSFGGARTSLKFTAEQIDAFIAGAESAVADWQDIRKLTPSTSSDIKNKAAELKSLLEDMELRVHLDASPAGQLNWKEIDRIIAPLTRAAQDLYRRTKPKGNRSNPDLNGLIELLVQAYWRAFQKPPGIGSTPFAAFVELVLDTVKKRFNECLTASPDRIAKVIKGDNLK